MFDFINWTIFWFVAIFIFAAIEIFTTALVTIWFIGGALAAWILSMLGFHPLVQFGVFLVASGALLFFTRPILEQLMRIKKVSTNIDSLIGAKGLVTDSITEFEFGEVKLDGKYWTAKSWDGSSIRKGEEVEIVEIDGVKLVVR